MPSLTQIRDAAVKALRAVCPEAKRVEGFSGELDLDAAKDKALPPGISILVAVLDAENVAPDLCLDLLGTFAVLVVVRDQRGNEAREARALAVAELATITLHGNKFGFLDVSPGFVVSLAPVAGEELDKAGLAAWTVVWRQAFTFRIPEAS